MTAETTEKDTKESQTLWTIEQAEAIEKREQNILVSAAAGSGKTAVLVERIKKMIIEENISLDEMLVVTFTNAAAAEMREKIVSAVPEQMDRIHKSHISTFHSFALEVIRRYFHLIGIEPGFRICDETQKILLQNAAMEELFRTEFEKGSDDFLYFLKLYGNGRNEDGVKKMILDTHNFIQSLPVPMDWLSENAAALCSDAESFRKGEAFREVCVDIDEQINAALISCEKVKTVLEAAGLKGLEQKAGEDLHMLGEIQRAFLDDFDAAAILVRSAKFRTFTPQKEEKERYEELREDISLLRQDAKDSLKNISARYCVKSLPDYISEMNETGRAALILCELVHSFDHLYIKGKEKQRVIDFSDIEHYALRILEHEEAAAEYQKKFRYIFIDEYQDSNLVQECLIDRIKRGNNLFMVGDVKQSIYKFRLAEPEIFISKYERYRKETDPASIKIDLNRNFRSKEMIIRTVNTIFEKVMTKRRAGMLYDDEAELRSGVVCSSEYVYPVELYLIDQGIDEEALDEEIRDMKRAELEAYAAAAVIKQSRGLPYCAKSRSADDGGEGTEIIKTLRNRDIVILLRSTANVADIYQDALQQEGIPAYVDVGDGFFDTLEVSVFMNLLKITDNRRQDIPLLSALRSPVFGFSVSELASIRTGRKKVSYFEAFSLYAEEGDEIALREKCRTALMSLHRWKQRAKFLPLGDFIWELLSESGYYLYAGALPGGTQRQGNLRVLADKAASYEANFSKGLFGFINYIEAIKKGRVASAPVKLAGESDDVVRIMTVHKSKGLEFPMVLVGGLGRRFRAQASDRITFHKDLGLALKQIEREKSCQRRTFLQEIIDRRKNRDDLAEEVRILYVALTRAKDKLVLLGTVPDVEKTLHTALLKKDLGILGENSYLDLLLPVIGSCSEVKRHIMSRGSMSLEKNDVKEAREAFRKAIEIEGETEPEDRQISAEVERRLSWEYPFVSAQNIKSKYSVSELSRETSLFEKNRPSGAFDAKRNITDSGAIDGAARGTIYHKVMEQLPFDPEGLKEPEIRAFLNKMVEKELLSEAESAEVLPERIEGFYRSDIGRRVCAAESVYRELPFNLLERARRRNDHRAGYDRLLLLRKRQVHPARLQDEFHAGFRRKRRSAGLTFIVPSSLFIRKLWKRSCTSKWKKFTFISLQ